MGGQADADVVLVQGRRGVWVGPSHRLRRAGGVTGAGQAPSIPAGSVGPVASLDTHPRIHLPHFHLASCLPHPLQGTEYDGGVYHGKLVFPADYPFKPPSISLFTPNGRFATNTKLCLSMTDYHPEVGRAGRQRGGVRGGVGVQPAGGQQRGSRAWGGGRQAGRQTGSWAGRGVGGGVQPAGRQAGSRAAAGRRGGAQPAGTQVEWQGGRAGAGQCGRRMWRAGVA